ncbi:hypothetical protein SB761_30815, partial [Pseudomonas sp. SIMBA_064]
DLERALAALDVLVTHTAALPDAARPNLQSLVSRFEKKEGPARGVDAGVAMPPVTAAGKTSAGSIASTRDLLDQARAMSAWLRDQENGY